MSYRVPNETTIVRVRIKSGRLDPLTARLRLTRILNEARVQPRGLPASAIVFIKTLRDPLPGALNLSQSAGPSLAWEQALGSSLDEMARSAARPALGHVPANAECVWFLHRSEMLASLAADWCDGSALARWWWRSLFRASGVSSAVVGEWLASLEYAPAAIAELAQKGMAITFVNALPASAVSRLLDGIIRHFGLTELGAALASKEEMLSKPANMLSPDESLELRTRVAPEAFSPRIEQGARVLLAAALMLERAPALLREPAFASRLVASLAERDADEVVVGRRQQQPQRDLGHTVELPGTDKESGLRQSPSAVQIAVEPGASDSPPPLERRPPDRPPHAARVQPETLPAFEQALELTPPLLAPDRAETQQVSPLERSPANAELPAYVAAETRSIPEIQVSAASIDLAIDTKFGGVFYLINAALALDLYGDFTRPREPGIELSIWDFLALMGRELIGKQIEDDPIWMLLAKLAGREESERPGACFNPPGDWRVPPEWLKAFPEPDAWSWLTYRGRLVVRHAAGFDVLDVKAGRRVSIKRIEARVANETRCYSNAGGFKRRRFARAEVRRRKRERDLDRWGRRVADYLRARLARSLGISLYRLDLLIKEGRPRRTAPTSRGRADDPTTMLFARAARVEVSPARFDVFFSLAELPVEIRLAGLDRDPGWLPAAGRAIAFHYD